MRCVQALMNRFGTLELIEMLDNVGLVFGIYHSRL